nr:DUF1194 domain-containing protein [Paracoccaceae bacterium]
MSIRTALAMAALAATAVALAPRIATADCADLALVLAIDSSGSVDAAEDSLQRTGYAAAFSDPTVQAALQAAGVVDVALVLWGDSEMAPQVFPWQRIAGPADVPAVATTLLQAPRRVTGNTGIGSGVMAGLDLLSAHCGLRQVINVSGDGIESQSPTTRRHVTLVAARARAFEMGVTINALAITDDTADL